MSFIRPLDTKLKYKLQLYVYTIAIKNLKTKLRNYLIHNNIKNLKLLKH